MAILPLAQYAPDQPIRAGIDASENIKNVFPRTAASYGPIPSLSAFSTGSLPDARVQGAYACLSASGDVNIFAGTGAKLLRLTAGATTFEDVSKAGGYSTATDERWSATLFGERVIMTNFADAIQSYVIGTSTDFADLAAAAPKARYIATIRDWIMVGNTFDATDGNQPQRVWWPAFDDPTDWPTPGSSDAAAKQSDFQDLRGDAGWIMGIVGNLGTAHGAIFQERAVVRVMQVGPPAVFSFDVAEGVRGTPAPGSLAQVGSLAYYLGEDGFYRFDGSNSQPIGASRVDKPFFADLDQSYFHRISGTADPINKLVLWAYPGAGHTDGNPNRILAYNWEVDRWSITEADAIECEILIRMLTPGYSLDSLDDLSSSIDALTLSLDSRLYTAGRAALAAFDTSHVLSTFTGPNLAPTVETAEAQLFDGQRANVTRIRPIVDGGTPSVTMGTRQASVDSVTWGTAVAANADGSCPVRSGGRYHRARITLPADSSFSHISGIEVEEASPAGRR